MRGDAIFLMQFSLASEGRGATERIGDGTKGVIGDRKRYEAGTGEYCRNFSAGSSCMIISCNDDYAHCYTVFFTKNWRLVTISISKLGYGCGSDCDGWYGELAWPLMKIVLSG